MNIIRIFSHMLLESYAVTVFLFFALSTLFLGVKPRRRAFFNALNGIGLALGLIALWGEVLELVVVPTGKFRHVLYGTPCVNFFRFLFIAALIGAVLVFMARERRKSVKWTAAGMALLLTPMLLGPFEYATCKPDYYPESPIVWHLALFSSETRWFILGVTGVFLCSSFFLGRDKELN